MLNIPVFKRLSPQWQVHDDQAIGVGHLLSQIELSISANLYVSSMIAPYKGCEVIFRLKSTQKIQGQLDNQAWSRWARYQDIIQYAWILVVRQLNGNFDGFKMGCFIQVVWILLNYFQCQMMNTGITADIDFLQVVRKVITRQEKIL